MSKDTMTSTACSYCPRPAIYVDKNGSGLYCVNHKDKAPGEVEKMGYAA